jgi:hypothetical protein
VIELHEEKFLKLYSRSNVLGYQNQECSTHRGGDKFIQIFNQKKSQGNSLRNISLDGSIILK